MIDLKSDKLRTCESPPPSISSQYPQLRKLTGTTEEPISNDLPNVQVDYALGNGGRSWIVGVGTDYPKYLWHKQSYASLINWASRQVFLLC